MTNKPGADKTNHSKVPIEIDQLLIGLRIPFEVFVEGSNGFECLFPQWTHFDEEARHSAKKKGITTVYIEGDAGLIAAYLGQGAADSLTLGASQAQQRAFAKKKEEYHQIEKTLLVDRSLFLPGSRIVFPLFEIEGISIRKIVDASSTTPFFIPTQGVAVKGDLAIRVEDVPLYQEYLQELFESPQIPPEIQRRTRAISLKENSKILMRDVLSNPKDTEKVNDLLSFIGDITDSILNQKVNVQDLMSLRNHDLYTYTHSVNVAVLSVALGAELGLQRHYLEKLGIGAMLHDVGKSTIPASVLDKPGQLTNEEFRLMRQHPIEGVRILESNDAVPKESLVAILQHHEKLSGNGYPLRLGKDKITIFGRITSLVDSYDALTTPRPYRYSHTPYMALALLTREVTEYGDYDPNCLKAFVKVVKTLNG
jgi:putative nucleotidyltransferase with HDIG domain